MLGCITCIIYALNKEVLCDTSLKFNKIGPWMTINYWLKKNTIENMSFKHSSLGLEIKQ